MNTFWNTAGKLCLFLGLFGFVWPFASTVDAYTVPRRFPRIANIYLNPGISESDARSLARWDVVIIDLECQYYRPAIFSIMREENPDIVILAYIPSEEIDIHHETLTDPNDPQARIVAGIADSWWLRNTAGERTGYWLTNPMIDVTNNAPLVEGHRWNTYLPTFVHEQVLSTGLWDGVFYDNIFSSVSWVKGGDLDFDRDSVRDDPATMDAAWKDGMNTMLAYSRALEGPDAILLGNGVSDEYPDLNGRLVEEFPTFDGSWTNGMNEYFDAITRGFAPKVSIINGKVVSRSEGQARHFRYVLTSTLLGNGFVSIDHGTTSHAEILWYDEYEVALGNPAGRAARIGSTRPTLHEGVWQREYENGYVFVNATDTERTIVLPETLTTLKATATTRDEEGVIVQEVTLGARDGVMLFKRRSVPTNAAYINGTFTKVFQDFSGTNHQEFFSYTTRYPGGAQVLKTDLDGDGTNEVIVANGNVVRIAASDGSTLRKFFPYGREYRGSVRFAVGDLDGDGGGEIVTGTSAGSAPHVLIFSLNGRRIAPGFYAGRKQLRTGVNVAVGDLDGDGRLEIVAAPAGNGNGTIQVYDAHGRYRRTIRVYAKGFKGGISVAAGDITGDRRAEIVTGPSAQGGPHIRVWSGNGRERVPSFFAFDKSYRGGVAVNITDFNGDNRNDLFISAVTLY